MVEQVFKVEKIDDAMLTLLVGKALHKEFMQ
jgi:hypothetical protein